MSGKTPLRHVVHHWALRQTAHVGTQSQATGEGWRTYQGEHVTRIISYPDYVSRYGLFSKRDRQNRTQVFMYFYSYAPSFRHNPDV